MIQITVLLKKNYQNYFNLVLRRLFRRINHYISVLKSSIESREREIERLKNKILIKKEGIRKHKNRGNELYDRLVSLKKQKEIVVYYTEGTSKKKLTGDKWSNNGGVKTYKQTNIKYNITCLY